MTRQGRRTPAVATGQAVAHQRTRTSSRDQSGILLRPGPDAFTGAEADCDAELASALDAAIATGLLNQHVLHRRLVALVAESGADHLYDVVEQSDRAAGVVWLVDEFRRLVECHGVSRPTADVSTDPATGRVSRVEFTWPRSDVVTTAKLALQGLPQQTGPERAEVLRQTGGGEAR